MFHSRFFLCAPLVLVAGLTVSRTSAQPSVSQAAAFRAARMLYDTPSDRGLQGFRCDVDFNWKQFLEKAINGPVQDTDERLAYLRSIKLNVTDDLNSTGELHWTAPPTTPEASEASIGQIRSGLQGLWSGFFQSWNGFMTGDLVSIADNHTTVERTPNGYHVFSSQNGKVAEETYSGDFTMQSLHVSTPQMDSVLTPAFAVTPHGRLITTMSSVVKQPPAAPGTAINTTVHYATVNGFQLPSELFIDVAGTASFDFTLNNCTLRMQVLPRASAPPPGH